MKTIGVLSMLHEEAPENSATRLFRNQPVLWWTLARLAAAPIVQSWTILCWGDQAEAVSACVGATAVKVAGKGDRKPSPSMLATTAASRWLDGWRGGLLQTSDFDPGFHGPWLNEILSSEQADALLLIDPSSGLVDPLLVQSLVQHADAHPGEGMVFSQAAPGLSGLLLRKPLLEKLARTSTHPGKLLAYHPDQLGRDPISLECCAPVPTPVARTTRRFKLDSTRQIRRLDREFESLNGQLIRTEAEALVQQANADPEVDPLPREITLELTPSRKTRPIWWPGRYAPIERPPLDLGTAERLFSELSEYPDTRLTFTGVGDPLLHPQFTQILHAARSAGLRALHVETDLLAVPPDHIDSLIAADIVSIHMPAVTEETYTQIMGVNGYLEVLENLKRLLTLRQSAGQGTPLIVPTFTKCQANLAEMEPWYDQWLRVLGSAVITGPTTCAGLIPDPGVASMEPPNRRPCPRLWNRLHILSTGDITRCQEDPAAQAIIAPLTQLTIKQSWQSSLHPLRTQHLQGNWHQDPLCRNCKEWHRP